MTPKGQYTVHCQSCGNFESSLRLTNITMVTARETVAFRAQCQCVLVMNGQTITIHDSWRRTRAQTRN